LNLTPQRGQRIVYRGRGSCRRGSSPGGADARRFGGQDQRINSHPRRNQAGCIAQQYRRHLAKWNRLGLAGVYHHLGPVQRDQSTQHLGAVGKLDYIDAIELGPGGGIVVASLKRKPIDKLTRVHGRANGDDELIDAMDDTGSRHRRAERHGVDRRVVRLSWSTQRYGSGGGQS
jgi:hypothetical protein